MAEVKRIEFSVAGDESYVRGFEATAEETRDMSEPLEAIGRKLREQVGEQFLTEGGAGSFGKWKALDPDYARVKFEEVGPHPMLVYTGDMRSAALSPRSVTVTPQRMTYEIDDDKAIYHQKGQGNLPARRLVDLSPVQKRAWDREFASWLNRIRRGPVGVV